VKNIRRATRRHFSAEDKIRIVLEGLRGEETIAELCRREGIVFAIDRVVLAGCSNASIVTRWAADWCSLAQSEPVLLRTAMAVLVAAESIPTCWLLSTLMSLPQTQLAAAPSGGVPMMSAYSIYLRLFEARNGTGTHHAAGGDGALSGFPKN